MRYTSFRHFQIGLPSPSDGGTYVKATQQIVAADVDSLKTVLSIARWES